MGASCRDRTAEFQSVINTLKKVGGTTAVDHNHHNNQIEKKNESSSLAIASSQSQAAAARSEFNKKASRIGLGIHETSQKISRLSNLAKKSSMFNDPIVEIQELTVLIKNDITALNMAVSDLQTLQNMEIADGQYSEDRVVHSTAVCDDLKSRLMGATKGLQDVLTTRTENMKAHENRKQMFSANSLRDSPLRQQPKTATEPPPWSTSPDATLQSSGLPTNGGQVGSQLRRRPGVESTPTQQMEMSMLQQVVPRQENYSQSRASALHNVESTITELSGIFTHLATMVSQQGELAIRIDDNMDESLANVDGAHSSLLRQQEQGTRLIELEMAPRARPRKNTRADAAYDAMKKFEFPLPLVKKMLKELLEVYTEEGWFLIEEDSYRVLIDAILEKLAEEQQKQAPVLEKTAANQQRQVDHDSEENVNESCGGAEAVAMENVGIDNLATKESAGDDRHEPSVGGEESEVYKDIHVVPEYYERSERNDPQPNPTRSGRRPCYGWLAETSDDDDDEIMYLTPEPLPEHIARQLVGTDLEYLI
ncbi:hypothetical protein ACFE04_000795 [Oxalis oulophora]